LGSMTVFRKMISWLLLIAMIMGLVSLAEEDFRFGVGCEYAAGNNQYSVGIADGENRVTIENTSDDTVYYRFTADANAQPGYIEGTVEPNAKYSAEFIADEAGELNVSAFGGAYTFSVCADGMHSSETEREVLVEASEDEYGVAAMEYYNRNSRIKDCTIYIDGAEAGRFTLADTPNAQSFTLPEAVTDTEFRIRIDTVYEGTMYQNKNYGVCITEVTLW